MGLLGLFSDGLYFIRTPYLWTFFMAPFYFPSLERKNLNLELFFLQRNFSSDIPTGVTFLPFHRCLHFSLFSTRFKMLKDSFLRQTGALVAFKNGLKNVHAKKELNSITFYSVTKQPPFITKQIALWNETLKKQLSLSLTMNP